MHKICLERLKVHDDKIRNYKIYLNNIFDKLNDQTLNLLANYSYVFSEILLEYFPMKDMHDKTYSEEIIAIIVKSILIRHKTDIKGPKPECSIYSHLFAINLSCRLDLCSISLDLKFCAKYLTELNDKKSFQESTTYKSKLKLALSLPLPEKFQNVESQNITKISENNSNNDFKDSELNCETNENKPETKNSTKIETKDDHVLNHASIDEFILATLPCILDHIIRPSLKRILACIQKNSISYESVMAKIITEIKFISIHPISEVKDQFTQDKNLWILRYFTKLCMLLDTYIRLKTLIQSSSYKTADLQEPNSDKSDFSVCEIEKEIFPMIRQLVFEIEPKIFSKLSYQFLVLRYYKSFPNLVRKICTFFQFNIPITSSTKLIKSSAAKVNPVKPTVLNEKSSSIIFENTSHRTTNSPYSYLLMKRKRQAKQRKMMQHFMLEFSASKTNSTSPRNSINLSFNEQSIHLPNLVSTTQLAAKEKNMTPKIHTKTQKVKKFLTQNESTAMSQKQASQQHHYLKTKQNFGMGIELTLQAKFLTQIDTNQANNQKVFEMNASVKDQKNEININESLNKSIQLGVKSLNLRFQSKKGTENARQRSLNKRFHSFGVIVPKNKSSISLSQGQGNVPNIFSKTHHRDISGNIKKNLCNKLPTTNDGHDFLPINNFGALQIKRNLFTNNSHTAGKKSLYKQHQKVQHNSFTTDKTRFDDSCSILNDSQTLKKATGPKQKNGNCKTSFKRHKSFHGFENGCCDTIISASTPNKFDVLCQPASNAQLIEGDPKSLEFSPILLMTPPSVKHQHQHRTNLDITSMSSNVVEIVNDSTIIQGSLLDKSPSSIMLRTPSKLPESIHTFDTPHHKSILKNSPMVVSTPKKLDNCITPGKKSVTFSPLFLSPLSNQKNASLKCENSISIKPSAAKASLWQKPIPTIHNRHVNQIKDALTSEYLSDDQSNVLCVTETPSPKQSLQKLLKQVKFYPERSFEGKERCYVNSTPCNINKMKINTTKMAKMYTLTPLVPNVFGNSQTLLNNDNDDCFSPNKKNKILLNIEKNSLADFETVNEKQTKILPPFCPQPNQLSPVFSGRFIRLNKPSDITEPECSTCSDPPCRTLKSPSRKIKPENISLLSYSQLLTNSNLNSFSSTTDQSQSDHSLEISNEADLINEKLNETTIANPINSDKMTYSIVNIQGLTPTKLDSKTTLDTNANNAEAQSNIANHMSTTLGKPIKIRLKRVNSL